MEKEVYKMAKKQFKTESKKLLDMMVNSIYTNKEIFIRELISNASDAIDKLYFRSLTDKNIDAKKDDFYIRISADKENKILTISDNGIGMTKDELENNLGTIAKSGSFDFKNDPDHKENTNIDIIGQFGVGFYSAFMVAKKIIVETKSIDSDTSYIWESEGADGYSVKEGEKEDFGTIITILLKDDTDDEKYSDFLNEYTLRMLIKKYSDYIRYPIKMLTETEKLKDGSKDEYEKVTEDETLNSMVPIWKKAQSDVSDEEYNNFYKEKFFDFNNPLKVIKQKAEGNINFEALLFISEKVPFNYYTKDYEKGLSLYSSGVMIMEKCKDLIPDYFGFVRGIVDSSDLSLNISREILQQDKQLKVIAKSIEKKIASELKKMLLNERETYEKFYKSFGTQLKWGIYQDYGMHKDNLKDLVMFTSSSDDKLVTLKEYVDSFKEGQEKIYYATGESVDKIKLLPQVDALINKGYNVLLLTEDIDEFALNILGKYDDKEFINVCKDNADTKTDEEKETLNKQNEENKEMFDFIKEKIGDEITDVSFTSSLSTHPVCLSTKGDLSIGMQEVLNKMPNGNDNKIKAQIVFEINVNHPIAEKLKSLYKEDKGKLEKYAKILYSNAKLISGLSVENPVELTNLICDLMI